MIAGGHFVFHLLPFLGDDGEGGGEGALHADLPGFNPSMRPLVPDRMPPGCCIGILILVDQGLGLGRQPPTPALPHKGGGRRERCSRNLGSNSQKFFASFFQKRRCLLLLGSLIDGDAGFGPLPGPSAMKGAEEGWWAWLLWGGVG